MADDRRPDSLTPMALPIEDYAALGDGNTAALVGRDGSIDWLCLPRFDSAACFAALLGMPEHGRWLVAPSERPVGVERRYRPDTLVLETDFVTATGTLRLVDFMVPKRNTPQLVRVVECLQGSVPVETDLKKFSAINSGIRMQP